VNLFLYPLNHGILVHKTNGPSFAAPPQEGEEAPTSKTLCGTSYELSK
jgi:hypothetical protein